MSDEWEMIVKVRLLRCMDHSVPDADATLRQAISDEGGAMAVISGWCDAEDLEIISLRAVLQEEAGHG